MNTPRDDLILNLQGVFNLPTSAIDWLVLIYDSIQVFDDVADNDPVSKKDLDTTIWNMLVGQYRNPFFAVNSAALIPLLEVSILKWHAANRLEVDDKKDAVSFIWRASYFDVVLMVVKLCHGVDFAAENAYLVTSLYGENLAEYLDGDS